MLTYTDVFIATRVVTIYSLTCKPGLFCLLIAFNCLDIKQLVMAAFIVKFVPLEGETKWLFPGPEEQQCPVSSTHVIESLAGRCRVSIHNSQPLARQKV